MSKIALLLPQKMVDNEIRRNVEACIQLGRCGHEVHIFGNHFRSKPNHHQTNTFRDGWQQISKMNFDLVINHAGPKALWGKTADLPYINTVTVCYGDLSIGENQASHLAFINEPVISMNSSQRDQLPVLNFAGNVYDDCSIDDYPFVKESGEYLVWSILDGDKDGLALAKQAAFKSGLKLEFIDSTQKHQEKCRILGNAFGLLITSKQEQTKTALASLATGTPLLAVEGCLSNGIITPKTGAVVSCKGSENEALTIAYNIHKLTPLNRQDCRDHADRLITEEMVENYAKICKGIITSNNNFRKHKTMTACV